MSRGEPHHSHFLPALVAGGVQSVVFNPIDRALYLRVHHRRSFSDVHNWSHPFQGFANAAAYRTVASGMYLFWQGETSDSLRATVPQLSSSLHALVVGSVAGSMNGVLLNPLQLVKFRMWSTGGDATFFASFREMIQIGGLSTLQRGTVVSVARDMTFGVVYELLRGAPVSGESTVSRVIRDCGAGMLASTISSPLNYARNQIYGSPTAGCPLTVRQLCHFLWLETHAMPTPYQKISHLNARLNVGWGTIRVGLGMAVGQLCYRRTQEWLR